MKQFNHTSHNQKICKMRGDKWRERLIAGRLAIQQNPTKLRIHRLKKKLTQGMIAQKLNTSISTYCAIEKGARPVSQKVANTIVEETGGSLNTLFKKEDKKFRAI